MDLVIDNSVGKTEIHYDDSLTNLFEATLHIRGKPGADIANAVNFMQVNDTDFSPSREFGVPTPNDRQWPVLDHAMRTKLGEVVEDLDRDPLEYLDQFKEFAMTLKGAPAASIVTTH